MLKVVLGFLALTLGALAASPAINLSNAPASTQLADGGQDYGGG